MSTPDYPDQSLPEEPEVDNTLPKEPKPPKGESPGHDEAGPGNSENAPGHNKSEPK
jgi:hypothetical protein